MLLGKARIGFRLTKRTRARTACEVTQERNRERWGVDNCALKYRFDLLFDMETARRAFLGPLQVAAEARW